MTKAKKETFLIIDAHALIHRAYHALPDLTSPAGEPAGAVYGFTSVLIKVLKELKPKYVIAAFDLAEPTFRHQAFESYKATRAKVEDSLERQFPLVRQVLSAFEIPILEHAGFEADDVIGTVVESLKDKKNITSVIVTGDLDTLQVVTGDKVLVYTLKRGVTDTIIYNEDKTRERFQGLGPEQLTDYKGLKGDPSDNIPGVPGIGEKTAITLLNKYKTIDEIYKKLENDNQLKENVKKKLRNYKDQALFSKELATIRRDVPISFSLGEAKFVFRITPKLISTLSSLGFESLIRRLKKEEAFRLVEFKEDQLRTENYHRDKLEEYYQKKIFSKKIYELERALAPVLRQMEETGLLIDLSLLQALSKKISKELAQLQKKTSGLAGRDFNLNSPQEVAEVLFEKLSLGPPRPKKTKGGLLSTAASELEKIKGEHPIVPLILRWRELSKLQSTYIEALPKLVSARDNRIHTSFKQFGAITGRLASENPNLQNVPIRGELGKEIRKAFIAKSNFLLVAADYSQIELRIAASLSGDDKMITTFENGEDIHSRTAAEIFNIPINKVLPEMRRKAKILNFGILYGMGPRAFSYSAGVSLSEAQQFIEEYKADFAGLNKFIEDMKSQAYAQGYIETVWGRRRYLPELASKNPGMRAAGERMAVNMPVQGTAADIIKAVMVALNKKIAAKKNIMMILQVHDELVFEVKKTAVKKYIPIIKEVMEGVIDLAVPLVVDIDTGPNWGELSRISNS